MKIRAVVAVWLTGALVVLASAILAHYSREYEANQRVAKHLDAVFLYVDHSPETDVDSLIHEYLTRHVPSHDEVLAGELLDGTIIRMDRAGASLPDDQLLAITGGEETSGNFVGSQLHVQDVEGNSAALLVAVDKQADLTKDRRNLGLLTLVTAVICALMTMFTALEPPGRYRSFHIRSK